jgi:hypothetical protein
LAIVKCGQDGDDQRMTSATNALLVATTCAECDQPLDPAETIPALDGVGRRCADFDACDDRKEARTGFNEP